MLFPEQTIAYDFANTGVYERSIIDWSNSTLMDSSKEFIDVGAHIGTWTLPFAKSCKRVHSFECSPRTYNFLCGNIALNGFDYKVKTYNIALGNETGNTTYYMRATDGGGNGCMRFECDKDVEEVTVPVATLDSFNLTNIGLIKIDVEGFEQNVLEGASETLKNNNYPKIIFESWAPWREKEGKPAAKLREELFSFLASLGYKIISIIGWDEIFLAEKS